MAENTDHGIIYPGPDDYDEFADMPSWLGQLAESTDDALSALDASMVALQGAMPIGAIIAWGGLAAPVGWHLCDGSAHGSTALEAILGSPNTPNLRDRFIVGAGSTYARGNVGGAAQVALTADQSGLPSHAHSASSGTVSADHQHLIDPPNAATSTNSHSHTLTIREGTGTGDGSYLDTNPTDSGKAVGLPGAYTNTVNHNHTVDIPAFWSGGISANHTHAITVAAVAAQNAAAAHENRPPFYALVFIIRKGA